MSLADPLRRAALALLAVAALLPAAALAQTPAPIRIGLIAPLSGGSADFGTSVRNGDGGIKDLTAELARRNIAPVYVGRFDLGVRDLTEELSAAREADADAVINYTVGPVQTRGNTQGPVLEAALENLQEPYRGVVSTFDRPFTPEYYDAFSDRMIWLDEWRNGRIVHHYPEDAKLSSVFRRKAE